MIAKSLIAGGVMMILAGAGSGVAQTCAGSNQLYSNAIASLVNGKYVCDNPHVEWNELHTGSGTAKSGQILDYKKGPGDPVDPSDTTGHPTGTYSISGPPVTTIAGTIQYTYTSGYVSPAFYVDSISTPSAAYFCTAKGGGTVYTLVVSSSHC